MIDWREYDRLWQVKPPSQEKYEFFQFLNFAHSHMQMKGIEKPVCVEIGIKDAAQGRFYKELLNAEYFGVDILSNMSQDIIVGKSQNSNTRRELLKRLDGRPINILFIDADHRYKYVKIDWELYGAMTANLVAFHDINPMFNGIKPKKRIPSVNKLWQELYLQNYSLISFRCPGDFLLVDENDDITKHKECAGIGVVILDREVRSHEWIIQKKTFTERYGENGEDFPLAPFHYNGGLNDCKSDNDLIPKLDQTERNAQKNGEQN